MRPKFGFEHLFFAGVVGAAALALFYAGRANAAEKKPSPAPLPPLPEMPQMPQMPPTPPAPKPAPSAPKPVTPFAGLAEGTFVKRIGFPEGFLEPKWQIVKRYAPKTIPSLDDAAWHYAVVAVPSPMIGTNKPWTISEREIEKVY